MVIGQAVGSITQNIAQMFDPLKTDFEKEKIGARAGAEALGLAGGMALGNLNLDPTTRNATVILGGQVGKEAAGAAFDSAFNATQAENQFVNDRVKAVLMQEASARAAVGGQFSEEDAKKMGKALADHFRNEFQNMQAAVSGTNKALGGLFSPAEMQSNINRAVADSGANIAGGIGANIAQSLTSGIMG